jgi:SAM-dependent methyltransferase
LHGAADMSVAQETLSQWEQAEVERSRVQATLSDAVKPTARAIFERYADPPADTAFPLEYLYHLVGDISGLRVLDYGCGDGPDTSLLAARGASVAALDLSVDLLGRAKQRLSLDGFPDRVRLLCGSAHDIPLADASVDMVVGHAILHHLDIMLASDEVFRVLRPGGRAVFLEPVRDSRLLRTVRQMIPYRQPDVSPFERPLLLAEVEAFSRPFTPGRRREFLLPFVSAARVLGVSDEWHHRLFEWDRRILQRVPALRYYAGMTVFELIKPR